MQGCTGLLVQPAGNPQGGCVGGGTREEAEAQDEVCCICVVLPRERTRWGLWRVKLRGVGAVCPLVRQVWRGRVALVRRRKQLRVNGGERARVGGRRGVLVLRLGGRLRGEHRLRAAGRAAAGWAGTAAGCACRAARSGRQGGQNWAWQELQHE